MSKTNNERLQVIAGDTAYLDLPDSGRETYKAYDFWDWASSNYQQVIVCLGNHDFYGYYDLATMPDNYCLEIRQNVHAYSIFPEKGSPTEGHACRRHTYSGEAWNKTRKGVCHR